MVWFALTFVALTAFAGLAIEYNRWENIGNRVQKAADAAALAGAVFMPENVGNKAYTTAKTIASIITPAPRGGRPATPVTGSVLARRPHDGLTKTS